MKRLLLIRHGKAPASIDGDLARELNQLGIEQAKTSAEYIKKHYNIDHVLVSPTKRTMQTFKLIQDHIGISEESVDKVPTLYQNTLQDIAYSISSMASNPNTLLVVGHNPSLLEFAIDCDKDLGGHFQDEISIGLQPAEVIVLAFPKIKNWEKSLTKEGVIEDIFIP